MQDCILARLDSSAFMICTVRKTLLFLNAAAVDTGTQTTSMTARNQKKQ
jgi:hypothetical protein